MIVVRREVVTIWDEIGNIWALRELFVLIAGYSLSLYLPFMTDLYFID